MYKEEAVYIRGALNVGNGRVIKGDKIGGGVSLGRNEEVDLSNAPEFIYLSIHTNSIQQNGAVYRLVGNYSATAGWQYQKLSGDELKSHLATKHKKAKDQRPKRAKVREVVREVSRKPIWESIRSQYPAGAITHPEFAGRCLRIRGHRYRMAQPVVQTTSGYVYIRA